MLIGCDGSKSMVREALVGEEKARLGDLDIYMFNVSVPFSAETALLQRQGHPIFKCAFHPTQPYVWFSSIQDVKDPDRPETWLFQHNFSWMKSPTPEDLPDSASRVAWWKSRAAEYADPWRTVGRELPEDINLGIDRIRVWVPDMDWSQTVFGRRVTIVGDAAHCMPPHRGQGLNNALQDSATLVEELVAVKDGKKTLADAVEAYEKEMKERSLVEIPISVRTARLGHDWRQLMETPAIKMGMNRYKADRTSKSEEVELATQPSTI
jgi:2-polyprenyl-6-methoxyphenol hydroxylase-like FAD-dependent oxidoreductase